MAARLKKLLFQLGRVVGVAAMEQASRPGVNRDEIVGRMDDSGARERKQYQGGDTKEPDKCRSGLVNFMALLARRNHNGANRACIVNSDVRIAGFAFGKS